MNPTSPPAASPFELYHDPWGRLVLVDAQGVEHVDVEPIAAFPISSPQQWISLVDAAGHEVASVPDGRSLPAPLRVILEEELFRRDFMPVIQRILSVTTDRDPSEWHVETDRGATQFSLDSDEDIRRLGPYRALLVDTHGIRYLIPDLRELDTASRRLLDRYF